MSDRSSLHIYNTLSRKTERFEPIEPGKVGLYVCGMTVYDHCHIGHARAAMTFDMVVRHLRNTGYAVRYVRNHTDVDDKIIRKARAAGRSGLSVSAEYIEALEADLDALGMIRPDIEPKVSTSIPEIQGVIAQLIARGHAYTTPGASGGPGDVYYAVESFEGYGKLSGKRLEDLQAGASGRVSDVPPEERQKRHPADFVLWKSVSGPAGIDGAEPCWDSPWGVGRPGWHIECSGMSLMHLGARFDIHGGGIDLVFPHHENEIAQSEGATGEAPFARVWMHNGHLTLMDAATQQTEKMSKSLGNVIRIQDIVAEVPGEVLRLAYLEKHYRAPMVWTEDILPVAIAAMDRIYQAKEVCEDILTTGADAAVESTGEAGRELYELAMAFPAAFRKAMDDDFNTAAALAALFELVRVLNRFGNDKKRRRQGRRVVEPVRAAFALVAEVLGIGGMAPAAFFDELKQKRLRSMGRSAEEIEERLRARSQARTDRDWAKADLIRKELEDGGILVMDGADGSTWRMKVS